MSDTDWPDVPASLKPGDVFILEAEDLHPQRRVISVTSDAGGFWVSCERVMTQVFISARERIRIVSSG